MEGHDKWMTMIQNASHVQSLDRDRIQGATA